MFSNRSRPFLATLLLSAVFSGQASAQNAIGNPGQAAICAKAKTLTGKMNYEVLLSAVIACEKSGRIEDGTFFLVLSQIRLRVDHELLEPANEIERTKRGQRMNYLFNKAGGPGPEHLYRDTSKSARLFDALHGWNAEMPAGYDPGWKYQSLPVQQALAEAADRHRHNRLEKLKRYSALMQDADYYRAYVKEKEWGCPR
jgi:hypothetical protein